MINNDITNFEYLIDLLSEEDIVKISKKYNGDEHTKSFFTKNHLKLFMFSEIKALNSLHDMESAMKHDENLNKIVPEVSYSTISRNDSERNPEIFVEIFKLAVEKLLLMPNNFSYGNNKDFGTVKILDSSTVTVSLKLFPWEDYKSGIGGIKMHTLFDLAHLAPEEVKFTEAELHDVNVLSEMVKDSGVTYLYDRAYVKYKEADKQTLDGIYFVSRLKSNAIITLIEENTLPEGSTVLEDKTVLLGSGKTKMNTKVRIILVIDERTQKTFYIVTNRFDLTADEISELYKLRWKIELFFKFIKGHMKIKHFYGNSYNAVKTQLFIAMTTYCLLMLFKLKNNLNCTLLELLRAVRHAPWGFFKNLIKLLKKNVQAKKRKIRKKVDWNNEYEIVLDEHFISDPWYDLHKMLI